MGERRHRVSREKDDGPLGCLVRGMHGMHPSVIVLGTVLPTLGLLPSVLKLLLYGIIFFGY